MAQREAVDTSFSNGEERAGAELPSPHNPEASADSLDRSTYQATHDAIVEAAQSNFPLATTLCAVLSSKRPRRVVSCSP